MHTIHYQFVGALAIVFRGQSLACFDPLISAPVPIPGLVYLLASCRQKRCPVILFIEEEM